MAMIQNRVTRAQVAVAADGGQLAALARRRMPSLSLPLLLSAIIIAWAVLRVPA
jgi:hypothetical protein